MFSQKNKGHPSATIPIWRALWYQYCKDNTFLFGILALRTNFWKMAVIFQMRLCKFGLWCRPGRNPDGLERLICSFVHLKSGKFLHGESTGSVLACMWPMYAHRLHKAGWMYVQSIVHGFPEPKMGTEYRCSSGLSFFCVIFVGVEGHPSKTDLTINFNSNVYEVHIF